MALAVALEQNPSQTSQLWMAVYGMGSQVGILLPYSRLHESEADHLGLIFMAMAGYDPNKAVDFWQRMSQMKGGQAPPEFLSTHPSDETRIRKIREFLPEACNITEKQVRSFRLRNWLRRLLGMGTSKAQQGHRADFGFTLSYGRGLIFDGLPPPKSSSSVQLRNVEVDEIRLSPHSNHHSHTAKQRNGDPPYGRQNHECGNGGDGPLHHEDHHGPERHANVSYHNVFAVSTHHLCPPFPPF
jgi:hypothetical protein